MIKKTLFVSGINLAGKLLGLLKIIILASIYGAGSQYDAYVVAYTLPTLLPQILTTIITTIFIPQFHKRDRNTKESWQGLNVLFTAVLFISLTATILLYFFSHQIVVALAPGLAEGTIVKAVSLFEIMSISTFIIGSSSFLISLSNAREKFYLASLDGLIINSIIIVYCIIYSLDSNIETIAKLIIIGFFIHFILLIISNRDTIIKYIRFSFLFKHEDFLKPISRSIPIVIGYIGAVASGIVDQWFTSYEDNGSISVLSYATMLYLLPMEVFGKAIMQTYFTRFSTTSSYPDRLMRSYNEGFKLLLFVVLPISLYLMISNEVLISLIFERGEFSSDDAHMTSLVLSALALGLSFRIIAYFNYRLLHAVNKSWIAISIGLVGVITNLILNNILSIYYGLIGIAVATTISLLISAVISCMLIKKYYDINYTVFINVNLIKITATSLTVLLAYNWATGLVFSDRCLFTSCTIIYNYLILIMIPIAFIFLGYLLKIQEVVDAIKFIASK